jgi:plasmid stabilization system protein ParE
VVEWTIPAKLDLKQIYDYIARGSKFYAQKVALEIAEKSEKLSSFPQIGRVVPQIGDPNIRELIIYSYRLIYEIFNNKIAILAPTHCKRNFSQEFLLEQRHEKN